MSDTPRTDEEPPRELTIAAVELDNWVRVRGSEHWECSNVASRRTINALTASRDSLAKELERWKKSFGGHVYVTNEDYSKLVEERNSALALVEQLRDALEDALDHTRKGYGMVDDLGTKTTGEVCVRNGEKALSLTPISALTLHDAHVVAEARNPLIDLLKRIKADYDHPWEDETELTTAHRLNIFHALSAALAENQGAKA